MNAVVKEWIAKAEEDWRVANREFQITNEPAYAIVCYHSQQCAEKYMKALLISHNIRPEYTHDLIKLSLNITEIIIDWVFDKGILYRDIPSVTPRQIRQALILSGISMSMIDDALSALPEPVSSLAKAEWEYSISFDRRRQLVQQVGILLGWTPEQLDNLWIFAGSIK